MRRFTLISLSFACFAALTMLTACSSSTKYDTATEESAKEESYFMDEAPSVAPQSVKNDASAGSSDQSPLLMQTENQPNLKLIWYADVEMETLNYDELLNGLNKTLTEFGGFIESSNQSGGTDVFGNKMERYSNLTIRIPSQKLDTFLSSVSTLGNVRYQDKRSENITLQYADNEARLATLKVEYDKLLELLEQAKDLADVIALEARLSEVRYQMDGLSSALRKYDDLVDYSTVNLSIHEVEVMSEQPNDSIGARITRGFQRTLIDFKQGCEDIVVFVVVKSPFIILFIVVIAIILYLLHKFIKKPLFPKRAHASKEALTDLDYPDLPKHDSSDTTPTDTPDNKNS